MFNNRIRTIARTATGSALLASGLGLAAFGLRRYGRRRPEINHAPERVYCQVYHNGIPVYSYPGLLPLTPRRDLDPARRGLGPFVCSLPTEPSGRLRLPGSRSIAVVADADSLSAKPRPGPNAERGGNHQYV